MLGSIAGDVIGSIYEHEPIKTTEFPLFDHMSTFTDDTVLTVAVASVILEGGDYAQGLRTFTLRYPNVPYAISLGGDSDTLACISGGIAQAFYGIPPSIASEVRRRLPSEFLRIIDAFAGRYLDAAW